MALFPKIQSPCPYKGDIAGILDANAVCRLCKREVHDLTFMSDSERVDFLSGCKEEVCVRYTIRPAVAAAALAAAAVLAPSVAQACDDTMVTVVVTAGGIKRPADVQYVHVAESDADKKVPMLPVVYDDKPAKVTAKAAP